MAAPTRTGRGPTDPTRRDRIADAALAIVLEQGVAAVSHRAIAERSGVPLGSTTYHFESLDDLLVTAVERAVEEYAEDLRHWSRAVDDRPADLVELLCDYVDTALGPDRQRTRAGYDLYFAALHRPALMRPARAWAAVASGALERHVGRDTARALTALLDGVLIQALVGGEPMPREELARILRTVLPTVPRRA
jgi:TetR/AcrR family transcriptional regulator, regulator of biofilm formation and stress response